MTDARSLIVDRLRYVAFDAEERGRSAEISPDLMRIVANLIESDGEALSVAAATSPPEGETRGEAAGWISVEDRLPDAAGYECLVCAVNENTHQTHVFTAFTGYGEPGWWTSNVHYMSRAKSPRDNKLHSALRVTHWMPLPEMPEVENDAAD